MVFLLNTFGKASVPIIGPIPFSSLGVDYASALRIGLATFSLPVLLGFGGINSRSNPYVLRSDATYLETFFCRLKMCMMSKYTNRSNIYSIFKWNVF